MDRVFVVLEGGGAKGVAHIGALWALEELDYEIIGIAGSSAGALVASLYALGFSSHDIINPTDRDHVLQNLDPPLTNATEILKPGWGSISTLKWVFAKIKWVANKTRAGLARGMVLLGAVLLLLMMTQLPANWLLGIVVVVGIFSVLLGFRLLTGLLRLDKFVACFNNLAVHRIGKKATFGDFGRGTDGRPILKVVATNITRGSMEVFSPDKTPSVSVAEAVAASICIPIIFRPRKITAGLPGREGDLFLDGGLVSNLPAWVFDDDRAAYGWPLTVVVEIEDEDETEMKIISRFQWLSRTIRTVVSGAKELSVRGVEPAVRVLLKVPGRQLTLTEFDAGWSKLTEVIEDAKNVTEVALDVRQKRQRAVDDLLIFCQDTLSSDTTGGERSRDIGKLRVSMAALRLWEVTRIKSGKAHSIAFRPEYWSRMEHDRQPLGPSALHGTVAEEAIISGQHIFGGLWDEEDEDDPLGELISTHQSKAMWNLCFAAFSMEEGVKMLGGEGVDEEDRSHLVVIVDGDRALEVSQSELARRLDEIAGKVVEVMEALTLRSLEEENVDET